MSELDIGFVIFPGITQLDFTGPFEVLSRLSTPPSIDVPSRFPGATVHVIAKSMQPVVSDRGLAVMPTATFDSAPSLDLLCVSGGSSASDVVADAETVDFIRQAGREARYATSVCTGAFLLGAAGLLEGRPATTHWAYADLLPLVGARHEKARIVRDGNVITAAGVSAGIDFAFLVAAELVGVEAAKAIQLAIEYDPAPPLDAGSPDKAPEAAAALMRIRNEGGRETLKRNLAAMQAGR